MLDKVRYMVATLRHSMSYANAINDFFLEYYLRHKKIIGWYKGLPVYSSFLTPGLSKPLANLLSRRLISSLIDKPLPGIVHIGVTNTCNAKCEHCSFFTAMDTLGTRVMDFAELQKLIRSLQAYGVAIINFVGGEPLLRKELPDIIACIDKDKSVSSIYTNGWFLAPMAASLKKAGTMLVNASLDAPDAEAHDAFRRLPGLFERALEGIKACRRHGLLTGISTTVTQEGLASGSFEHILHLAKKLRVNEVIVFDAMPVGMYSHRVDLSKKPLDRKKLLEIVDTYNADPSYPGIFCYAHFRDTISFGCSAGRNYCYISPYGDVCPCDFTAMPVGNIKDTEFARIWLKMAAEKRNSSNEYMNSCCASQEEEIYHIGSRKSTS